MNPTAKRKALPPNAIPDEPLGDGRRVGTTVALRPQHGEQGKEQQVRGAMPVLAAQLDDEPRYTWGTRLTASANAGPNARLRVRIRLTVAHWSGNGEAAARVADKLVDNAFCHAQPIGPGEGWVELRLTVLPTTDHLLVEVDDAMPEFPCFESASTAEPAGPPPGLWWVRHYRGALSWGPKTDNATGDVVGKTVAAILPTTWAAAS